MCNSLSHPSHLNTIIRLRVGLFTHAAILRRISCRDVPLCPRVSAPGNLMRSHLFQPARPAITTSIHRRAASASMPAAVADARLQLVAAHYHAAVR